MAVLSLYVTEPAPRLPLRSLCVWLAAAALAGAACYRVVQQPTFWLDEAFVAVSLRTPSLPAVFGQLEYGQLFPRIYLSAIAITREVFGYHIWSLRLLPFLSFIAGTLLWARLLVLRSRDSGAVAFLAAALLIGATFWLDQAIQLKQYTFDVLLALVPFVACDALFDDALVDGKRRARLVALALPCLLSYTYPLALGARVAGWYLQRARRGAWRLNPSAVLVFAICLATALIGVWFSDHRFNIKDNAAYLAYWNDCLVGAALRENPAAAVRLIAKFLWGWHGRQPLVTAVLVPLQAIGVYAVIRRMKGRDTEDRQWGSRSLGSLVLLLGVLLASALANYPICAGRVVLFTQIHTQLLAIEGALLLVGGRSPVAGDRLPASEPVKDGRKNRPPMTGERPPITAIVVWVCAVIVAFHSIRAYARLVATGPAENLRPVLSLIRSEEADVVVVHSCSVAQVRSLPDPLPVNRVVFATAQTLPRNEKAWVLWTHLGNEGCVKELEELRRRARSWQIVNEGPGRGLALAEF